MTSKLPSAKEMNEMMSRKKLSDELVELKRSHKKALDKMRRENSKLANQLKDAEDKIKLKDKTITQKDRTIEQKKDLLSKQYDMIENLKKVVAISQQMAGSCTADDSLANVKSPSSTSSSTLSPKKGTVPSTTSKKKE